MLMNCDFHCVALHLLSMPVTLGKHISTGTPCGLPHCKLVQRWVYDPNLFEEVFQQSLPYIRASLSFGFYKWKLTTATISIISQRKLLLMKFVKLMVNRQTSSSNLESVGKEHWAFKIVYRLTVQRYLLNIRRSECLSKRRRNRRPAGRIF
jgi:hypothetical protein